MPDLVPGSPVLSATKMVEDPGAVCLGHAWVMDPDAD